MKKIFIDGSAGTTGLRIKERLLLRKDIELIILPEEKRKDEASRRDALNSADIAVLCLPDDAAREAAAFAENPDTVIIDTSTAHRTDENFIYGFPEIADNRQRIAAAKRIANPGCHASGFISLIAPLTENKIIAPDTPLSCFSLTGYSGGGKKMTRDFEGREKCGNIKMISNDGARGLDTMCAPTAKIILRMMTSHRRYGRHLNGCKRFMAPRPARPTRCMPANSS